MNNIGNIPEINLEIIGYNKYITKSIFSGTKELDFEDACVKIFQNISDNLKVIGIRIKTWFMSQEESEGTAKHTWKWYDNKAVAGIVVVKSKLLIENKEQISPTLTSIKHILENLQESASYNENLEALNEIKDEFQGLHEESIKNMIKELEKKYKIDNKGLEKYKNNLIKEQIELDLKNQKLPNYLQKELTTKSQPEYDYDYDDEEEEADVSPFIQETSRLVCSVQGYCNQLQRNNVSKVFKNIQQDGEQGDKQIVLPPNMIETKSSNLDLVKSQKEGKSEVALFKDFITFAEKECKVKIIFFNKVVEIGELTVVLKNISFSINRDNNEINFKLGLHEWKKEEINQLISEITELDSEGKNKLMMQCLALFGFRDQNLTDKNLRMDWSQKIFKFLNDIKQALTEESNQIPNIKEIVGKIEAEEQVTEVTESVSQEKKIEEWREKAKTLLTLAAENEDLRGSLGQWLGSYSLDNKHLSKYKETLVNSKEELKELEFLKTLRAAIELIEKGITQLESKKEQTMPSITSLIKEINVEEINLSIDRILKKEQEILQQDEESIEEVSTDTNDDSYESDDDII